MSRLTSFFFGEKKSSATVAADRLEFILKRERRQDSASVPDYLPALQQDLIAVISRYTRIHPDDVQVQCRTQGRIETLEVKVELPLAG